MIALIFSRTLVMIPNIVLLTFLLFACMTSFLGTPAAIMLGEDASPAAIAELNAKLGFDGPLMIRYLDWIGNALAGDLGRSYATQQPVASVIADALPLTLELAVWAIGLAFVASALINSIPYMRKVVQGVTSTVSLVGITIPNFFLGMLLIYIFSVQLRWLPTTGWSPWSEGVGTHLLHMLMPILTLTSFYFSSFSLIYKSEYKSVENSLYIGVARSKGLSEARISYMHILPNSILPLITYAGGIVNLTKRGYRCAMRGYDRP